MSWIETQMRKCVRCGHIEYAHVRGPSGPYCWSVGGSDGCGCVEFVPPAGS